MNCNLAPLGEIADVIRGVSYGTDEASDMPYESYLPILRAGNIKTELELEEDLVWIPKILIQENQKIKKDDLVMCTSSGSAEVIGKIAKASKDWKGSFGAFCAVVRARPDKIQPSFLAHFLRSQKFKVWTRKSLGANIKNIRKSELEEFKIPLPTINEQRRIAAILDKADAIRKKRREALKLADKFLRSLFLEMFGDPVANPKGLQMLPLSDVSERIQIGPFGTQLHQEDYVEGATPVINPTPIIAGKIRANKFLTVPEELSAGL